MNTYVKFCPNVFLAKCDEKHEKGEVIEVTTKYGNENESIVFNLIFEKDGFFYYSIVRADGFNVQRNGRSKELNVEGHGLNRQNVKAKNTLTNLIKIEIFFHLVNLSRWDTTAKDGTGKQ